MHTLNEIPIKHIEILCQIILFTVGTRCRALIKRHQSSALGLHEQPSN